MKSSSVDIAALKITETGFRDLYVLEPKVHGDARGYFLESYNKRTFEDIGININFVQDNQSSSRKGVLRGLHFQAQPYAQTKLVRTLQGSILDVVVDLRRNEPTFARHYSVTLSEDNKKQLLVPKGFAHGFVVLSDQAVVFYKCDEYYQPSADGGINFADPALKIDWNLPADLLILSEKDKNLPRLADASFDFG